MFYLVTGNSVQMTLTSRNGHSNGKASVASQTFRSLEVEIPEALESLILASCRHQPAERPHTMTQLLGDLRLIAGHLDSFRVGSV